MARKRTRHTLDVIEEALTRLGLAGHADPERLRRTLGLPETDGYPDDADLVAAVREARARAAFAASGAAALVRSIPDLRRSAAPDGGIRWALKVRVPLAEGGVDARVVVPVPRRMAAVLDRMAARNDPSLGIGPLKAMAAEAARDAREGLAGAVSSVRQGIASDLRELGAEGHAYACHLRQSLDSQLLEARDLGTLVVERVASLRASARRAAVEDARMRRVRDTAGFGSYLRRFEGARGIRRRIVFHMGPTNSGKTYGALRMLAGAASGSYLAPLRLLALENYEALREMGLRAGMVTGEEVLGERDATHVSRTIETADLVRPVEVAVIDEIQMLTDPSRGWAWTNALMGIPARTVVVCGSDDALPYVRRAAEAAGESLDVVRFERKTPLLAMAEPVPLERVRAGDAVVAFSRRAVHEHREALVAMGHEVATIYGALSPEVRRAEAQRFRDGTAGVLVTTDAIGMGLNLGPLSRVVFASARKWDGVADRPLTNPEIRQIAGRAGRFGHHEVGYVSALTADALEPVREALSGAPAAPPADSRFFVRPDRQAIVAAGAELGTGRLSDVLAHFARSTFYRGSPFQPCALDDTLDVAAMVDRAGLPLADAFAFSVCPVDRRDELSMSVLQRWTQLRARGARVPALRLPEGGDLAERERAVRLASAYLWLSRRFPETFDDADEMRRQRTEANEGIEAALRRTAARRARGPLRGVARRSPEGPGPFAGG